MWGRVPPILKYLLVTLRRGDNGQHFKLSWSKVQISSTTQPKNDGFATLKNCSLLIMFEPESAYNIYLYFNLQVKQSFRLIKMNKSVVDSLLGHVLSHNATCSLQWSTKLFDNYYTGKHLTKCSHQVVGYRV